MFDTAYAASESAGSTESHHAHVAAKAAEQRLVSRATPASGPSFAPKTNGLLCASPPSSNSRSGNTGNARKRARRSSMCASDAALNCDDSVAHSTKRHNSGEVARSASGPDLMDVVSNDKHNSNASVTSKDCENPAEIGDDEAGSHLNERISGATPDVLAGNDCVLGVANDVPRSTHVPLIPFGRQNVPNWDDGMLSGFDQSDNLNVDPNELLECQNWILGDIDDVLNHDTQYLQLQVQGEPEPQQLFNTVSANSVHTGRHNTINTASISEPAASSDLPDHARSSQPLPFTHPPERQTHSSASSQEKTAHSEPNPGQSHSAPPNAPKPIQNAPTLIRLAPHFAAVPWNHKAPLLSQDIYADVRAPDIETRIIAAPQSSQSRPPSSSGSAIRIAPRDGGKPGLTIAPVTPDTARTKSVSRPKRGRQSTSPSARTAIAVKSSESPVQRAPFFGTVPYGHLPNSIPNGVPFATNPQIAPSAAVTIPPGMPIGSNIGRMPQPPGSMPAPHPMAAPLLFAQGFPMRGPNQPAPFLVPSSNNASPSSSQRLDGQAGKTNQHTQFIPVPNSGPVPTKPISTNSTERAPGSSPVNPVHYPPNVFASPMTGRGMAHMNQATMMHMAQQLWYAALTASNNSPVMTTYPDGRFPYGAAPFLTPAQSVSGGPPHHFSVAVPETSASPVIQNRKGPTPPSASTGKGRPIYITDDGKHVVVEQQAPAKLMKHPVLGRLQLQSRQNVAMQSIGDNRGTTLPSKVGSEKIMSREKEASAEVLAGSSFSKERRKRLVWTPELHDRFVQAISAIGIHQAVPKTLVQIMNVEGLTTEHVKSHLQKYRNLLRKATNEEDHVKIPPGTPTQGPILVKTPGLDKSRSVRIVPSPVGTVLRREQRKPQPSSDSHAQINEQYGQKLPTRITSPRKPSAVVAQGTEPGPSIDSSVRNSPPLDSTAATAIQTDGNNDSHTGQGDADAPVAMQERAMELQYQLQLMVHRTVLLQKKLQQLIVEKHTQQRSRGIQIATSEAGGGAASGSVDGSQTADGVADIEIMKRELDRQSAMVRDEIGMMQEQLGKVGDVQTSAALTAANKMKQELDRQANMMQQEIGIMQGQFSRSEGKEAAAATASIAVAPLSFGGASTKGTQ